MTRLALPRRDLGRAILVGVAVALILSLVMVPANLSGVAPMPKPSSPDFAALAPGAGCLCRWGSCSTSPG